MLLETKAGASICSEDPASEDCFAGLGAPRSHPRDPLLDRKIEKMTAQLIVRLYGARVSEGIDPAEALAEVIDKALDFLSRNESINLNLPAFKAEQINLLGRAAAVLARQSGKVSDQFPGTMPEDLIMQVSRLTREKVGSLGREARGSWHEPQDKLSQT